MAEKQGPPEVPPELLAVLNNIIAKTGALIEKLQKEARDESKIQLNWVMAAEKKFEKKEVTRAEAEAQMLKAGKEARGRFQIALDVAMIPYTRQLKEVVDAFSKKYR